MVSGGDIFISNLHSEELGVGSVKSRFVLGSVELAPDRFELLFASSLADMFKSLLARVESLLARFDSLFARLASSLARVELVDSSIASVKLCLEFVSILCGEVCSAVAEADSLISQFRLVSVSPALIRVISVSP